MTKKELVDEVASSCNISRRQAERVIEKTSVIVMNEVKHGQKVNITGFGTFYLGKRAARAGINPNTKEKLAIPKVMLPKFRPGSRFKSMVR